MKLRDYQEKAIERILESWKKFRSCLIVLPTGCGKTVVFGELIHRILADPEVIGDRGLVIGEGTNHQPPTANHQSRAMILAHREELITQAADKVGRISGADVQIEMGDMKVSPMFGQMPHVVVSTVQTQTAGGGQVEVEVGGRGRGRRMDKFDPADFGVLVIDEAHHATAKSYRTCIEHYLSNPKCRLLGVTATPDRADESALGNVFDVVAFEYTVTEAIRDGWLVPVKQRLVKVDSLDFSKVSSCAGDFNQGELAQVLEEEQNLHSIAVPTVEICGNRRTIIFAASVKQAERLAEILNRGKRDQGLGIGDSGLGIGDSGSTQDRAAWVCGMTPKDERRQILEDFKAGRIQYLVNVGVLTEGYDDAGVEVVVMARPTKSRALYAQMAGRATRPAAEIAAKLGQINDEVVVGSRSRTADVKNSTVGLGPTTTTDDAASKRRALIAASSKPECTILDFVGNSGRHKLVSTVDILGGKDIDEDEEEARRRAKKRCEESGEAIDMIAVLEKSREEIRREKTEQAKRRNFIQATAKFIEVSVDPFNIFDLPPVEESVRCPLGRSLSWRQKELLREKLKIDPDRIGAAHARQLLDEYFRRVNEHLATFGQMKMLRKFGVAVPMRFDEASRTLNRLLRKAS